MNDHEQSFPGRVAAQSRARLRDGVAQARLALTSRPGDANQHPASRRSFVIRGAALFAAVLAVGFLVVHLTAPARAQVEVFSNECGTANGSSPANSPVESLSVREDYTGHDLVHHNDSVSYSPSLTDGTYAYTASVDHEIAFVELTIKAKSGFHICGSRDNEGGNGETISRRHGLATGENQIKFFGNHAGGDLTGTRQYTLTITRALNDDARIGRLLTSSGSFADTDGNAFSTSSQTSAKKACDADNTLVLSDTLESSVTSLRIYGTLSNQLASIAIGRKYPADANYTDLTVRAGRQYFHTNGSLSGIPSAGGKVDFLLEVTAEDGETKSCVELKVTRKGANTDATLSGITVTPGTLSPAFFSGRSFPYAVQVAHDVEQVTFSATTTQASATFSINPDDADGGTLNHQVNVPAEGSVDVTFTVTAPDGATKRSYIVSVSRDAAPATTTLGPGDGSEGDSPGDVIILDDESDDNAGPLTGFTLVDASDQSVLATLTNNASVALADPTSGSYGIRADVDSEASIGSVKLDLDGPKLLPSRTENVAPYSLYGDRGADDLRGGNLPVGTYTLTAAAFSGRGLSGDELGKLSITFTVTQDSSSSEETVSAGPLTGFTLVDASDQSVVSELTDSSSVALSDPNGGSYAIRVDVDSTETIGSVQIELSGAKAVPAKTENVAPYSLYGDGGANALSGGNLPVGSYRLRATAYSGSGLSGNKLGELEVSFTVTEAE